MQRAGLDFELEGGPGSRGAEITGGMFLTQMGIGGYAALDNFGVTQIDEATALLQKRKKLQEVEAEYTRKRRDFDERMKRCKDREAELAAKQEVIRVNVVRFERFIKDNDIKRQRALKKERDEIAERLTLQREAEALELSERRTRAGLTELMDTLARLAKYKEFLEEVVEASEFTEIPEVLSKFGTMRGTNEDLRLSIETGNEQRTRLFSRSKDKEDEVMAKGAQISQLKQNLEALRADNAKADDVLEQAAKSEAAKVMEHGASTMAIANLFKRCKDVSRGAPRFTMSEVDLVLDFIQHKVTDLAFAVEVHRKGPETAGLKMDTFSKRVSARGPGAGVGATAASVITHTKAAEGEHGT